MADTGSFAVSPAELSALAAGFSGLVAELHGVAGQVGSGNAAPAGAAELEEAISDFTRNWSMSLTGLHDSLGELQQRLGDAAGTYSGADGAVARSLPS